MRYTQMLNQRLKNAGREYAKSREMKKTEELWEKIREVRREAQATDSFFPWAEAAARLSWSREEEELLAVLWGLESRGEPLSEKEFLRLRQELAGEENRELPNWYIRREDEIRLSPVLRGWLEGEIPELPEGLSLRLPEEEPAYGLDASVDRRATRSSGWPTCRSLSASVWRASLAAAGNLPWSRLRSGRG
ncbi:MAG: hypothetical protein V8Q27_08050 [Eubacteriales bacterium]